MEKHESGIEQAKQGLIQEATALAGRGDQANLARGARELQKRWTDLGNGRLAQSVSANGANWAAPRAMPCLANWMKHARSARARSGSDSPGTRCTNLSHARTGAGTPGRNSEGIAQDQLGAIDALKSRLRELDGRWQAAGVEDRGIVQRQREARDAIAVRLKDAARQQRLSRYTTAMQKYTLLRSIENGAPADAERWAEIGPCTAEFEGPLEARYALAGVPPPGADEADDEARDNLVRLEFLAGMEISQRRPATAHEPSGAASVFPDARGSGSVAGAGTGFPCSRSGSHAPRKRRRWNFAFGTRRAWRSTPCPNAAIPYKMGPRFKPTSNFYRAIAWRRYAASFGVREAPTERAHKRQSSSSE